jgi:hypothetical protein
MCLETSPPPARPSVAAAPWLLATAFAPASPTTARRALDKRTRARPAPPRAPGTRPTWATSHPCARVSIRGRACASHLALLLPRLRPCHLVTTLFADSINNNPPLKSNHGRQQQQQQQQQQRKQR